MAYETVLYEVTNKVATITLNRPEALNALSPKLEDEMHQALDEADADEGVRASSSPAQGGPSRPAMMSRRARASNRASIRPVGRWATS